MKLSIDYSLVSKSLGRKELLRALMITTAITLNLLPLFFRERLNANAKLILALSGFISAVALTRLPETEFEKKLKETYSETELKEYKTILLGEVTRQQSEVEINNQIELAKSIEKLPDHYADFFAPKYGVESLITRYYITNSETEHEGIEEPVTTIPVSSWFYNTLKKHEAEENLDLEWLKKAATQSCFIAGKKGSGKSFLMRYLLLAFIEQMTPNDSFYIIDPHYDPDSPWIQNANEADLIVAGRIADQESAIKTVRFLHVLLRTRIKHKETFTKTQSRVRIFFDEIDSFSDPEEQQEISNFIRAVENQGRKYGFTIVCGSHSVKKGEMNIDSSVVNSMLQLLFPSVLLDRNSILSGAVPSIQSIKSKLTQYKSDKAKDVRAIGIVDDSEFYFSHVPNLKLAQVEPQDSSVATSNSSPDPLDLIADWCKDCLREHNRLPQDSELKLAWEELRKESLTENGLKLLKASLIARGFNF